MKVSISRYNEIPNLNRKDYLSESNKIDKDYYRIEYNKEVQILSAKQIIKLSREYLCFENDNRETWLEVIKALYEVNNLLARCCVPECIYRGWCYENTTCDYHKNIKYRKELNDYRDNINGYGGDLQ